MCNARNIVLVVSVLLAISFASPASALRLPSKTGIVAKLKHNPIADKALEKVAGLGLVFSLTFFPIAPQIVLADGDASTNPTQATQDSTAVVKDEVSRGTPEGNAALLRAMRESHQNLYISDYVYVLRLIGSGAADINARDEDGNTALHYLLQSMRWSHDVFERDNFKMTQLAAQFLELGADPQIANHEGVTPHELAADRERRHSASFSGIAALIVKEMVGINGQDKYGLKPLDYAIDYLSYARDNWLAKGLVAAGADVHGLRRYHPISAASLAMTDRDAFLSLLEEEGGMAFLNLNRSDPAELLVYDYTATDMDKQHEDGINYIGFSNGDAVLANAAILRNEVTTKALLDYGVNPTASIVKVMLFNRIGSNSTPLYENPKDRYVREKVAIEALESVLGTDTDFNVAGRYGFTPLHVAASEFHEYPLGYMLEHGALPNTVNKYGRTALHIAAMEEVSYFEKINLLLAHGAFPDVVDREGFTAYDYIVKEYDSIVKEYGPAAQTGWARRFRQLAAASAAVLLKATVGAEGKDAAGRTPMTWAKLSGSELVQEFVAGEGNYLDAEEVQAVTKEIWR